MFSAAAPLFRGAYGGIDALAVGTLVLVKLRQLVFADVAGSLQLVGHSQQRLAVQSAGAVYQLQHVPLLLADRELVGGHLTVHIRGLPQRFVGLDPQLLGLFDHVDDLALVDLTGGHRADDLHRSLRHAAASVQRAAVGIGGGHGLVLAYPLAF